MLSVSLSYTFLLQIIAHLFYIVNLKHRRSYPKARARNVGGYAQKRTRTVGKGIAPQKMYAVCGGDEIIIKIACHAVARNNVGTPFHGGVHFLAAQRVQLGILGHADGGGEPRRLEIGADQVIVKGVNGGDLRTS